IYLFFLFLFFFSSRRRHTRSKRDWSSDVCSSDLKYYGLLQVDFINGHNAEEVKKRHISKRLLHYTPIKEFNLKISLKIYLHVLRSEERRVGKECRSRCE